MSSVAVHKAALTIDLAISELKSIPDPERFLFRTRPPGAQGKGDEKAAFRPKQT